VDAPGANDDGSGTVLTMELARVFADSGLEFDATLVFICWAGEEQGLIGSAAHAQRIAAEKVIVEAMISNDIVGNSRGGTGVVDAASVRVYAVGPEDSPARALARYIVAAGATYVPSHRVRPMAREDRFGRGSDQSSFTQQGYPAVVFREANENFDRQHSARDTLDGVDFAYLAQNARVNAAAMASLALAPAAPVVVSERGAARIGRDPSGYDAALRWARSAIASTGARRGATTGSTRVRSATSPKWCCPACRSTTGCSASRRSVRAGTRAWSAPTSRPCARGGRSSW
jgi:Zn-dependent M28 family amino/carboxypeptidase